MNKKEILHSLKEDVFCRLKPSLIHGIGVFAIRDIPKGTNPFKCTDESQYIRFTPRELKDVSPAVVNYVKDVFVYKDGAYHIPQCGLNAIDFSYFLNHSKTPNMVAKLGGEFFVAARDIPAGEELTVDYDTYDEDEDDFRQ